MIENLKILREERGLSQEKLGAVFGLSQQSIYKYETQSAEPDIGVLIRMAAFFDVSVDFLIGGTTIRRKQESVSPNDLNEEEAALIARFRALTGPNRRLVLDTVDALAR